MFFATLAYLTTITPHFNALTAVFIATFALLMLIMLTSRTISATGSYIIKIHYHFPLYAIPST